MTIAIANTNHSFSFSTSLRYRHRRHRFFGTGQSRLPLRVSCMSSREDERIKQVKGSSGGDDDLGSKVKIRAMEAIEMVIPPRSSVVIAACTIGLLTGVGVVIFNNAVHEIRDFFWDGLPSRGASWLREKPLEEIWQRVVLVPVCGGLVVGMLNSIKELLDNQSGIMLPSNVRAAIQPFLKAVAASVTLGTGNSLGPEGPSVEIGASIAKGVGSLLGTSTEKRLPLIAAGSAAGISSGFNAAVSGCFFAVESVLWPSPSDDYSSLTNSTSMVILSGVIAAVISEVGLGPVPAFTVPGYDFRSPSELPLYLFLGILCGLVSRALSKCTFYAITLVDYVHKASGVTKSVFPVLGGLTVGLMALAYPEILYWGFENVDILLESQPYVKGLPADLLLQLVGVKIVATSLSRATGLVGGYYAPSLFIGAATGMAYGKFMIFVLSNVNPGVDLSLVEVASPQAYGLVGMAATLAGVCQVPLTSVLLLFELMQDYRIVLPLLGAVGLSLWVSSTQSMKNDVYPRKNSQHVELHDTGTSPDTLDVVQDLGDYACAQASQCQSDGICDIENTLCLYKSVRGRFEEKLTLSDAMRTTYLSVFTGSSLSEAVTFMLTEKQSYAIIVTDDNILVGFLALEDIQNFCMAAADSGEKVEKLLVSKVLDNESSKSRTWSVTPEMTLLSARKLMDLQGVNKLPVVSQYINGQERGYVIGLLDRDCIDIACRSCLWLVMELTTEISEPLNSLDFRCMHTYIILGKLSLQSCVILMQSFHTCSSDSFPTPNPFPVIQEM